MSALSDQVVSIATLVYLLAMISHAVEYALGNSRAEAVAAPARELVGAAVGGGSTGVAGGVGADVAGTVPPTAAERTARRAELAGRIAVVVTALGAALHLVGLVTRGLAADRMPWGNMYEFVLTVSFIGVAAWLVVLVKMPSLRRLGLFLTLVMVLLVAT
ncbi:c-type cytochrome biogenesis protein CcsB, partial [Micromonospora sp. NPDC051296]